MDEEGGLQQIFLRYLGKRKIIGHDELAEILEQIDT
jgi:hypothetical protein